MFSTRLLIVVVIAFVLATGCSRNSSKPEDQAKAKPDGDAGKNPNGAKKPAKTAKTDGDAGKNPNGAKKPAKTVAMVEAARWKREQDNKAQEHAIRSGSFLSTYNAPDGTIIGCVRGEVLRNGDIQTTELANDKKTVIASHLIQRHPNGTVTYTDFNNLGAKTAIAITVTQSNGSTETTIHDPNGVITGVVKREELANGDVRTYVYNSDRKIIGSSEDHVNPNGRHSITYRDADSKIIGSSEHQHHPNGSHTITFRDAGGQRTKVVQMDLSGKITNTTP